VNFINSGLSIPTVLTIFTDDAGGLPGARRTTELDDAGQSVKLENLRRFATR
jgi:hypothetical protein